MTDDEDSEEPAVTLGTQRTVEGAPLARVSARLMWGIEKSAVREREGETVIRTPDGSQELGQLLDSVDKQYFATRQEFEDALSEVIGDGPVPAETDEDEEAEGEGGATEEVGEEDVEASEDGDDAEDQEAEEAAEETDEQPTDEEAAEQSDEEEAEGDAKEEDTETAVDGDES